MCFWEPGPKLYVVGEFHVAVEFFGGTYVCLPVIPGLFMWSWLVGTGVVLFFL